MIREATFADNPVDYIAENSVAFGTALTEQANNAAALNHNKCWFNVTGGQLTVCDEEDDDAIEAYWCPYYQNGGKPIMLSMNPDDPGVMFTAKMNGCTFDVAYSPKGSARVVHVNDSEAAKGISNIGRAIKVQISAQHHMAERELGQIPDRGIDTAVGDQVRIVGMRMEKGWKFWKIDQGNTPTELGHREAEKYLNVPHVGPTGEEKVKDKKCIVM